MKKTSPSSREFDDEDGLEKRPNILESDNDEDGCMRLETILEVPIPEEIFRGLDTNNDKVLATWWPNLRYFSDVNIMSYYFMKAQTYESTLKREFFALMKLVGSPFIPTILPQTDHFPSWIIENSSLVSTNVSFSLAKHVIINNFYEIKADEIFRIREVAKAKYILNQYIAATGGKAALNLVKNMYVVGQMKMLGPEETHQADDSVHIEGNYKNGSFVLCQQNPNSWYLEMVVHGFEFNAGCDGNISWFQSSWQPHSASKGPPRPLRRLIQGLDPRFTANLFWNAICAGEKMKTGLLIQLTDVILLRTKVSEENDDAFWAICIESEMEDYRKIDGINIAHAGKTYARLDKYGENDNGRWKIKEKWKIEEVDFNVHGLSMDNFLPPATDQLL
ncbi:hypothetical protein REPUB_Repub19eG0031500 [Reevesia pubescens]